MGIPTGEDLNEVAARLSDLVNEAFAGNLQLLVDDSAVALAERAVGEGARESLDGQYQIHVGALIAALNFHFLRGRAFGSGGDFERAGAIRGVLEGIAQTDRELAEFLGKLRDNHAHILVDSAAEIFLRFSSDHEIKPLLAAEMLVREALAMTPDETIRSHAESTFLAVAKTLAEKTEDLRVLDDAIQIGRAIYERVASAEALADVADANSLSTYGSCLRMRAARTGDVALLEDAVVVLRTVARIAPTEPTKALAHLNLSQALYALAGTQDPPAVEDEAFYHVTAAADLVAPDERHRHRYFRALGNAWMHRDAGDGAAPLAAARAYAEALRTADELRPALLEQLAESVYRAFCAKPADTAPTNLVCDVRETLRDGWAAASLFRGKLVDAFRADGDQHYLDMAVRHAERAVRLSERSATTLSVLGSMLAGRFQATGLAAHRAEAVTGLREALAQSENGWDRFENATDLAWVLQSMFNDRPDPAVLDECIDVLRIARAVMPRADNAVGLASCLTGRFQLRNAGEDRDEAIGLWRTAAESAPDDPRYVQPLIRLLVNAGLISIDEERDLTADATEALAWAWRLRRGHPSDSRHLLTLANAAVLAGTYRANAAAVREVIDEIRAAVITPPWTEETDAVAGIYVSLLELLFEETREMTALAEAIEVGRRLLERPAIPADRRTQVGVAFAECLVRRAEFTDSRSDLDEAIIQLRRVESLDDLEIGRYVQAARAVLADALINRYGYAGSAADLDEAITLNSRDVGDKWPLVRAAASGNLCMALSARGARHRDPADLLRAIEAGQEAVALTPEEHRERPRRLFHLAVALLKLAQMRQDDPDMAPLVHQAVAAAREAINATPSGHSEHLRYAQLMAGALMFRRELLGDAADLNEAMRTYAAIIDGTTTGTSRHTVALLGLSQAYLIRSELAGDSRGDLESAVSCARQAVESAGLGSAYYARGRILLARSLDALGRRTGDLDLSREAAGHLRDAALATTADPLDRIDAAQRWGQQEVRDDRREQALEAWTTVVDLLPVAVWFGLDRSLRESHLRRYEGVARIAGAAALNAARPDQAVSCLELGRNVLWAGLMQTRTSLDEIRASHPELVEGLERVRAQLDALDRGAVPENSAA